MGTGLTSRGKIQNLQDPFERKFWKTQQDPKKRDGKTFVCSKTWDPLVTSCTRMEGLGLILQVPSNPSHSGSLGFHNSSHSRRCVQPLLSASTHSRAFVSELLGKDPSTSPRGVASLFCCLAGIINIPRSGEGDFSSGILWLCLSGSCESWSRPLSDVTLGQDTPSVPSLSCRVPFPARGDEGTNPEPAENQFPVNIHTLEGTVQLCLPWRCKPLFSCSLCQPGADFPGCQQLQEPFPGKGHSWLEQEVDLASQGCGESRNSARKGAGVCWPRSHQS